MNKLCSSLAFLFFIIMLYINYLSGTGQINDISAGEVSGKYTTLITPAGFTFTIWSLIYLTGLIFVINLVHLSFKSSRNNINKISCLYLITCILNITWIFTWHYEVLWMSEILMVGLLLSLITLYRSVSSLERSSTGKYLLTVTPISLYLGWITIATVANTSVLLVSSGWYGSPLSPVFWACTMVIIAAVINIAVLIKERDIFFALVYLWAAYGIIAAQRSSEISNSIWIARIAFGSMLIVFLGILYARFISFRRISS